MSRIVCKMNPHTMRGCIYQRKQYKKARYRKKEQRQWNELDKSISQWAKGR